MLLGKTVNVSLKDDSLKSAYPWEGAIVPVKITGEYPKFLVGTVLPHTNPKGFKQSEPYTITIPRWDIKTERILIS